MNVSWDQVVDWLQSSPDLCANADTLLGVARAGVPICTALSYLHPHCSLFFATRSEARGEKPPEYDFCQEYSNRVTETQRLFELPKAILRSKKVLILDDVATTGATLTGVAQLLLSVNSSCDISYASFAADTSRLTEKAPDLLRKLSFKIDIDNSKTWVSFPWNLNPLT
jgi:adenine/guanine phosphoribosyltransferase-like PRPP-binding protein